MGQLEDTKGQWGCLISNTIDKERIQLVVINNNSQDNTVEFIEKFVFPHFPNHKLVNNPENVGVLKSMQQAIDETNGDIIAILHNDLYIFTPEWDDIVKYHFEDDDKVGLAGFIAGQGIHVNGGRVNTVSNMLEAEVHGERLKQAMIVSNFDGMALIGRRKMFEEVGGFDLSYSYHHFYDRDISLASHFGGWKNLYIPISCHHRSGITANRPDYQYWIEGKMGTKGLSEGGKTGDQLSYDLSEKRFFEKWGNKLGFLVTQ